MSTSLYPSRSGWTLIAALASLLAGGAAFAEIPAADVLPGEIVVDLRDDVDTEAEIAELEAAFGIDLRANSIWSAGEMIMRAPVDMAGVDALLDRLEADPRVEHAELDHLYGLPPFTVEMGPAEAPADPPEADLPNDPLYKFQWHLELIRTRGAWPVSTGAGIIVAVIDTGVAYEDADRFLKAPDLAGTEFVAGYDFVNDDDHANDDHGHGTHVAGTIAQSTNNAIGVAGVAYGAKIMPLKVLSASGTGNVADIADAIHFAADHGAKVINMSLGGRFPSKIMRDAVAYAHKKGVLVVCAAGNDGRRRVGYPAAYPHSLAVSAVQFDESLTFYSNYGPEVDLAAPGGNTQVDQNGDGMPDGVLQNTIVAGNPKKLDYLMYMGTSMAAPHVAGVAALVMALGVTDPDAAAKVMYDAAREAGAEGWDEKYGHGIVDASAAVRSVETSNALWPMLFALLMGVVVTTSLRRRNNLEVKPGVPFWGAALVGSAGVAFFLPLLGLNFPGAGLLTNGLPAWDVLVFGAGSHANPLFYSALFPLVLAGLLGARPKLRSAVAGLGLGVAAHLLWAALWSPADIVWIPGGGWIDALWLGLNASLLVGMAHVIQRKR